MLSRISVIIPTKNRPLYLRQAVRSVLDQTYPVYEVLIVNDGSEEEYLPQLDEIKLLDKKIAICHFHESRGPSFARNFALDNAKGDIILFLDDDDLIHPEMIRSSLHLFKEDVDIVFSLYMHLLSDRKASERMTLYSDKNKFNAGMHFAKPVRHFDYGIIEQRPFYELLRYAFPIHTALIRKSCLENIRFPEDLDLGEDAYFWLCMASKGCRFKCSMVVGAFYRLHDKNHMHRVDSRSSYLKYLCKLKSSGMLQGRDDLFYTNGLIFMTLIGLKRITSIKYLLYMLKTPEFIPKYVKVYLHKQLSKQYSD
ncbi:Glycosyltransferase AglG [uncultured archaeon]|nr:Glycosyltransferase AglG [uncultured archaeon]